MGLLFHAFDVFHTSKDKHVLRDNVQKCQRQMRAEFGIQDVDLLPCVKELIASALKFEF